MPRAFLFLRHSKAKRVAAMLAVVLALSSGAQDAHLLCGFLVCNQAAGCEHDDDHRGQALTSACCSACDDLATAERETDRQEPAGECPCPQDCWCKQSADPAELPRVQTVSVVQWLTTPGWQTVVASAAKAPASFIEQGHGDERLACSARERSARLCRFLI